MASIQEEVLCPGMDTGIEKRNQRVVVLSIGSHISTFVTITIRAAISKIREYCGSAMFDGAYVIYLKW